MVEVVGDVVMPSNFILQATTDAPTIQGQMAISGTSIVWYDGSSVQTLSGSNTGD